MEMVKLRTGYEAVQPVLIATKISVESLFEKGILGITSLYDLVMVARDPKYVDKLFESNLEMLQGLALIDSNKTMHDEIRQCILALIEGEGMDMKMVNPLAT